MKHFSVLIGPVKNSVFLCMRILWKDKYIGPQGKYIGPQGRQVLYFSKYEACNIL